MYLYLFHNKNSFKVLCDKESLNIALLYILRLKSRVQQSDLALCIAHYAIRNNLEGILPMFE
jgi:hypothetical protein